MARVNSVVAAAAGVVLLGAGFGLGMFVAGSGGRETRVEYLARSGPAVPPDANAVGTATTPTLATAPSPPPSGTGTEAAAVRSLLDALEPWPVPTGTGVVTGRVVREDGAPLPGVQVTLSPEMPGNLRPNRSPGEEPTIEELVAETARGARWWREARQRTATDGDGRFRFEAVVDGDNRVNLVLRGWQISPVDRNAGWRARPGADLQFRAMAQLEMTVEVQRPDGTVPENAQIRFTAGNSTRNMGWSPGAVVRVEPGTWQVSAATGEQQEYQSESQTVTVEEGTEPPALRFVVRGQPGIRGKVILEGYTADRGVTVAVARIPADARAEPALLSGATAQTTRAIPNRGGAYFFKDIAPGRYVLGVFCGQRSQPVVVEEVEVGDDLLDRDLRITSIDPGGYLLVRTQGPDGKPVVPSGFLTGYRSLTSSSSGGGTWLRRDDGAYLVEHQDLSGIGGGGGETTPEDAVWWVDIQTEGFGTKRVEYRRVPNTEVSVRFDEPAILDVVVTGLKGTALEGVLQLAVVPASDSKGYFRSRGDGPKVDAEGKATVTGIQPGEYFLVFTSAGDRSGMQVLARVPVTVRAGRNPVSVPAPVLHRVTVLGVDGSARVLKTGDPFWHLTATPDADGRAVFDGLPDGHYTVQCGQKQQEFDLPGTSEIRL